LSFDTEAGRGCDWALSETAEIDHVLYLIIYDRSTLIYTPSEFLITGTLSGLEFDPVVINQPISPSLN